MNVDSEVRVVASAEAAQKIIAELEKKDPDIEEAFKILEEQRFNASSGNV